MRSFILFALAGLAAQLVDGALGMAYGVTSTTLLLAVGASPAVASASVHLAEIGTSLASGAAHWRFGNVDWKVVARIGVPGAFGGFAGATVLSSLSTEAAAPWTASLLLALGAYILLRFTVRPPAPVSGSRPLGWRFLAPLGVVAGFVDATGGGGWGPIATSTLISSGRLDPRKTIGSVNTSEFVVTVATSVGFLFGLGHAGISFATVAALLLGGILAAPLAAWLVHRVPLRLLGTGVGGIVIITNARTLLKAFDASPLWASVTYGVTFLLWGLALAVAFVSLRRERLAAEAPAREPELESA